MKKLFLFLFVTCSVVLTSCSNDDDDEANAQAIEEATDTSGNSILGDWFKFSSTIEAGVTTEKKVEYNFNTDKTGSFTLMEDDVLVETIPFTWSRSGDEYIITGDGETSDPFTISDANGIVALVYSDGDIMAVTEESAEEIEKTADTKGNTIIGFWVNEESKMVDGVSETKKQEYNFNTDGTGTYKVTETGEADVNISFTWVKSGDEYSVTGGGQTATYTIGNNAEGNLALIDNDGDISGLKS